MEKSKLFLVPLCFLVLTGCPVNGGDNGGEKLSTPELSINSDKNGLTWEAVAGAASYSISVNDGEATTVTTPGFAFSDEAGNYTVKVVAKGTGKTDSDAAQFSYTTSYTALGNLSLDDQGRINWSSFAGAGLQYTVDGGTPVTVEGNAIAVETGGVYTVKALPGYVETTNKYYVDKATSPNEKTILVQPKASEAIELEMGDEGDNATLQEKYVAQKYTSAWEASSAVLTLDGNNDFSPSKAVRANVYCNGTWFKWRNDNLSIPGSVNYFSFFAKATAPATTRLYFRFEITRDVIIAGLNFKSVYLTYPIDQVSAGWKSYVVGMDDAKWQITYNNTAMSFADVKSLLGNFNYTINSLGDLFPYFGSFQILAKGEYTDNGPKAFVYMDEVKLGVGEFTPEVKDYTVHEYAWSSNLIPNGLLRYVPAGESFVRFKAGADTTTIPVTVEPNNDGSKLTITSTATGSDFVATVNMANDGTFALDTVSGSAAPYMVGMTGEKCHVMFDFENFSGDGIGYDASHKDETKWTGLRSKWFSDYYSGSSGNPSPVGGSGWSMMGSSDYLGLSTSIAHTGSKSMRLKYNASNQLRFITWDCTQAPSPRLPKATYMSLWVRACGSRDNHLKIRAVRLEQVKTDNHGAETTYTTEEVTIPADTNHGWVEVKIALDPEKNYYGLAILPMKNSGSSTGEDNQYFYVDDICLYNNVRPF